MRKPKLILSLLALSIAALPLADANKKKLKVSRPDLSGASWEERFRESYLALSNIEPEVTEIEKAILDKIGGMIVENEDYARKFLAEMLAEGNPVSAAFNQSLGNLYFENGQFEESVAEYKNAISKFERFQRAWNGLGFALYELNNYPEAAKAFSKSIKYGAADATTYGLLAYCHLQAGHYRSAEAAYNQATINDPTNADWAEGMAQIYSETGRHLAAQGVLEELIRKEPDNVDFWLLKANNFLTLDEPLKTARSIEIARRLGTIDTDTFQLLGNIYLQEGMYEQAKDTYVAAVKQEGPVDNLAALRASRYLIAEDQMEIAREVFELITEVSDNWTDRTKSFYYSVKGSFAAEDGFSASAEESLEKALEFHPFNGRALLALADIKIADGNNAEAHVLLDRALQDEGAKYASLVSKALLLVDELRYEQAINPIQSALAINRDPELKTLLDQVIQAVDDQNKTIQ
ncbi:MAG: tetratricopeptide repeat protein [Verrucomicrobiota bacterium]